MMAYRFDAWQASQDAQEQLDGYDAWAGEACPPPTDEELAMMAARDAKPDAPADPEPLDMDPASIPF